MINFLETVIVGLFTWQDSKDKNFQKFSPISFLFLVCIYTNVSFISHNGALACAIHFTIEYESWLRWRIDR